MSFKSFLKALGRKIPIIQEIPAIQRDNPKLLWQKLESNYKQAPILYRTAIEGGWLISNVQGTLIFIPDPDHEWDGNSYPIYKEQKSHY